MNEDTALNSKPFDDSKVDNIIDQEGVIDDSPILAIDISDKDLINNLRYKIKDSQDYWNDPMGYNLQYARNDNVRMYLGRQIDKSRLYNYQVPYMDNELFVGAEAVFAYVAATPSASEVRPGTDTLASKILAADLEKVHKAHSERFDLQTKEAGMIRNNYLKRVGVIKLVFDPHCGEHGDIVPQLIDPDTVIFDKNTRQGENPGFICEVLKSSVEDLIKKFPDKKEDIYKLQGIKMGTPKQMGQIITYREVWFTFWDKDERCEGVAWYVKDLMLDKRKSPNWIYKDEGLTVSNFLDYPEKPYVFMNYINDGSHLIDQTTPIEQAAPVQEVLNKRGRQIIENADTANAMLVLKAGAIGADDAQNITGDTMQKLVLDSKDGPVSDAFGQIPPHLLPQYVLDDKIDLRNTIHNILGTPSQFRGDNGSSQSDTLGEAVMIKNQASGRQDALIRSHDIAMEKYYKLLTQMMKVHYTDKHYFTVNGQDGNFDFIEMSRENIEDGATVCIQSGSSMPFDKDKQENVAIKLAEIGLIDPYNLFQDLHLPNADKRFDAYLKWKMDAASLRENVIEDQADRTAYIDYISIMNGKEAKPRDDASNEHILSHRKQMLTDRFLNAKVDIQRKMVDHVQAEVNALAQRTQLDEQSKAVEAMANPQPPQPEIDPATGQPVPPPDGSVPPPTGQAPQGQPPAPQGPPPISIGQPPMDVASILGATPA
jgi:hypothetical protein